MNKERESHVFRKFHVTNMSVSFSLYLKGRKLPAYAELSGRLGLEDLRCEEEKTDIREGYLHLYRKHVSTRSIELALEPGKLPFSKGTLQVRILTGSCKEDFELALRAVEQAALLLNASIEPEDAEAISIIDFRKEYGADWVAGMIESGSR
jgi:hypothetical protein